MAAAHLVFIDGIFPCDCPSECVRLSRSTRPINDIYAPGPFVGRSGISDTFASALWVADALFSPAAVGVDGVSVHTLPNAAYQLFRFSDAGGRWRGRVQPVFYGVELLLAAPLAAPAAWAADGSDVVTVTGGSAALVTVGR
jgi:hypothetical protein